MQKPWSLYNKEDKLRVDDLTPEQVRIVLLATASKRMSHWYACQEGDVHWQPIDAIPEFYEDVRQIKGTPDDDDDRDKEVSITKTSENLTPHSVTMKIPGLAPLDPESAQSPPPVAKAVQRRPMFEDPPEDGTAPTLQIEFTRTKERRTARRYPRVLGFKISASGKTFQCETVDISMAGLLIDQDLPDWAQKTFTAELSLNQNTIKVMCTKVSERKLKMKDSSSWDVIRAWIVNW